MMKCDRKCMTSLHAGSSCTIIIPEHMFYVKREMLVFCMTKY